MRSVERAAPGTELKGSEEVQLMRACTGAPGCQRLGRAPDWNSPEYPPLKCVLGYLARMRAVAMEAGAGRETSPSRRRVNRLMTRPGRRS